MSDYNSGLPVRPSEFTEQFPVEIKDNGNASLIGQKAMAGSLPVTLASDQGKIDVSISAGDDTALTQTGGALDVNLKTNDVKGQATMANSLPVVLASDQTNVKVDNYSGTGTSIGAVQDGLKVALIDDADGSYLKGQKTMAEAIPVSIASDQSTINVNVVSSMAANPVHDYNTAAAVAVNASSDHSYTVATTALKLSLVQASASGKMRVQVIDKDGITETVLATDFNSTADPSVDIWFPNEVTIAVGHDLVIRRKNIDKDAQDVYSFINGLKA